MVDSDYDEAECRVCRGEEEEERKLFAPCFCRGSIKWTHSDCLIQWLEHCGKEICELCSYKFEFSPLYAEGTPEELPLSEIVSTLVKLVVCKWIPTLLRMMLVVFSWLIFIPWATSWLYRVWLLRAPTAVNATVVGRLTPADIYSDVLAGVVLTVCIFFTFLSFMSFADYLRFHWHEIENAGNEEEIPRRRDAPRLPEGNDNEGEEAINNAPPRLRLQRAIRRLENEINEVAEPPALIPDLNLDHQDALEGQDEINAEEEVIIPENNDDNDNWEVNEENPEVNVINGDNLINNNLNPNPIDDGDGEVEQMNLAVDELLGMRGPIMSLFRNLLWTLAFNGAYLGIFSFIPYTLGSSIINNVSTLELPYFSSNFRILSTEYGQIFDKAIQDGITRGDALQFYTFQTCLVGQASISITLLVWRLLVSMLSSYWHRSVLDYFLSGLNCLAAVVKVTTLLIVKMLLAPVLLGIGIDLATLNLFNATALDRFRFSVEQMIGSILIHWVLGITFMLFVTVSVLQLREVVHPCLLASIIRPQESQPDLLKTLLSESCMKHARRMFLSLSIYLVLLFVLIDLPIRFASSVFPTMFPVKFHLYYFIVDIQVPLELFVIHMIVLVLLEKYKNYIGKGQYSWMKTVCEKLQLTEYLLPLPVSENTNSLPEPVHPPPLHFHHPPQHPPAHARIAGRRYVPWPEDIDEALEVRLRPRQRPNRLILRLSLLIVAAWVTIVFLVNCYLLFPLLIGRCHVWLLQSLWGIGHDPIAFGIGCASFWWLTQCFYQFSSAGSISSESGDSHQSRLQKKRILFIFGSLWFLILPLLTGVLFEIVFLLPSGSLVNHGLVNSIHAFQDYMFGTLLLHLWVFVTCSAVISEFRRNLRRRRRNQNRGIQNPIRARNGDNDDPARLDIQEAQHDISMNYMPNLVRVPGRLKLVFRQILKGVENEEILKIEEIDSLISFVCFPLCHLFILMLTTSLFFIIVFVNWMNWDATKDISIFRTNVIWILCCCLYTSMKTLVKNSWKSLHKSIRDDRYLIGRQLLNLHKEDTEDEKKEENRATETNVLAS